MTLKSSILQNNIADNIALIPHSLQTNAVLGSREAFAKAS